MIKNFTIDNTKFSINISGDKPQNAETFTPSFYEGYPELKEIKPSFIDSDGTTDITFLKDNIYYYIKINQSTTSTLKNESSEAVCFSTKGDSETSVAYLRFNTEQELSFFITRHIFPELHETYTPKGEFSIFTTTKQILDWWNAINDTKNMFDPFESFCYGRAESNTAKKGKGYNKHNPLSYFNDDKDTWDRDLPNLETSFDEESQTHIPLTRDNSFKIWKAEIPNVVDGQKMFERQEGGIRIEQFQATEYSSISTTSVLNNLIEGQEMFKNNSLSEFKATAENLCHGISMFEGNPNMTTFGAWTPKLVNGRAMLKNTDAENVCIQLTSLTNGFEMFKGCRLSNDSLKYIATNIRDVNEENKHRPQDKDTDFYTTISITLKEDFTKSEELLGYLNTIKEKGWTVVAVYKDNVNEAGIWSDDNTINEIYYSSPVLVEKINVSENLQKLVDGSNLFASTPSPLFDNESLVKFVARLTSLEVADNMFYGCTELRYFKAINLGNLISAFGMFSGCFKMTQFDGDLSALEDGEDMFYGCKLGVRTLQRIANTIKTHTSGTHKITIGMNCKETEYETSSYKTHIDTIKEKGWEVLCGFNK